MRVFKIFNNKIKEIHGAVRNTTIKNEVHLSICVEKILPDSDYLEIDSSLHLPIAKDTISVTEKSILIKDSRLDTKLTGDKEIVLFLKFVAEPDWGNMLEEANEIISKRERKYGSITVSFDEVAQMSNLMFTPEEMKNPNMTSEKVLKVMKSIKIIRDKYSPENRDHLRDECGYTRIMEIVRRSKNGV